MTLRRIATVDIGTNTILMLIAECVDSPPRVRVLQEHADIARLGEGIDATRKLSSAAIERAVAVCRRFGDIAREEGAELYAVGTQALREVNNATAFLATARPALGGEIEIISGKREADLAYRAIRTSFPAEASDCVVADIGGGSTEIIVTANDAIVSKASTKLGSVRLHERFCTHDPPSDEEWRAMKAHIDENLPSELPAGIPCFGIAGTVTSIAAIQKGIVPYDGARVQGARIPTNAVVELTERLRKMPLEERRRMPGLDPKRADVLPAGAAILERILLRQRAPEVIVSDRGIRWGLLYEKLEPFT